MRSHLWQKWPCDRNVLKRSMFAEFLARVFCALTRGCNLIFRGQQEVQWYTRQEACQSMKPSLQRLSGATGSVPCLHQHTMNIWKCYQSTKSNIHNQDFEMNQTRCVVRCPSLPCVIALPICCHAASVQRRRNNIRWSRCSSTGRGLSLHAESSRGVIH